MRDPSGESFGFGCWLVRITVLRLWCCAPDGTQQWFLAHLKVTCFQSKSKLPLKVWVFTRVAKHNPLSYTFLLTLEPNTNKCSSITSGISARIQSANLSTYSTLWPLFPWQVTTWKMAFNNYKLFQKKEMILYFFVIKKTFNEFSGLPSISHTLIIKVALGFVN